MRARRAMSGSLYIPVGIPGCGKSTWAEKSGHAVVSSDSIRERYLSDVNNQSANDYVFRLYHRDLAWLLAEGDPVVADATNLRDFARRKLRNLADIMGAETHLVLFRNPAEAVQRNLARERVVPQDAMERMLGQYERALRDIPTEGYTTVTEIGSYR